MLEFKSTENFSALSNEELLNVIASGSLSKEDAKEAALEAEIRFPTEPY